VRAVIELDVAWIAPADLEAVDALVRLQLAATRRGVRLRLRHPSADLCDLLQVVGLEEVLELDGDDDRTVSREVDDPPANRRVQTRRTTRRMPR
jgi:hypothetical protein